MCFIRSLCCDMVTTSHNTEGMTNMEGSTHRLLPVHRYSVIILSSPTASTPQESSYDQSQYGGYDQYGGQYSQTATSTQV